MGSQWPTSIDNIGHVTGTESTNHPNTAGLTHSEIHNLIADAITALETNLAPGGGGGSSGYASLTGAGQTITPGDLTQTGGFTVIDPDADGIVFNSSGGPRGIINLTTTGQLQLVGNNVDITSVDAIKLSTSGYDTGIATADVVGHLPIPLGLMPGWGLTADGHIYFYPTGGPWTAFGGGGGGSGYASLTGAGQTATPGDLTQAGNITVTGNLTVNGTQFATNTAGGVRGISIFDNSSLGIILDETGSHTTGGGSSGLIAIVTNGGVVAASSIHTNLQDTGGQGLEIRGCGTFQWDSMYVFTADVVAHLATPTNFRGVGWGFTTDGHMCFYPRGGPWTSFGGGLITGVTTGSSTFLTQLGTGQTNSNSIENTIIGSGITLNGSSNSMILAPHYALNDISGVPNGATIDIASHTGSFNTVIGGNSAIATKNSDASGNNNFIVGNFNTIAHGFVFSGTIPTPVGGDITSNYIFGEDVALFQWGTDIATRFNYLFGAEPFIKVGNTTATNATQPNNVSVQKNVLIGYDASMVIGDSTTNTMTSGNISSNYLIGENVFLDVDSGSSCTANGNYLIGDDPFIEITMDSNSTAHAGTAFGGGGNYIIGYDPFILLKGIAPSGAVYASSNYMFGSDCFIDIIGSSASIDLSGSSFNDNYLIGNDCGIVAFGRQALSSFTNNNFSSNMLISFGAIVGVNGGLGLTTANSNELKRNYYFGYGNSSDPQTLGSGAFGGGVYLGMLPGSIGGPTTVNSTVADDNYLLGFASTVLLQANSDIASGNHLYGDHPLVSTNTGTATNNYLWGFNPSVTVSGGATVQNCYLINGSITASSGTVSDAIVIGSPTNQIGLGGYVGFGGGTGTMMWMGPSTAIPTSNPSSGFFIYIDPGDNKLKARGQSGTITTLANP